jgi:hypothetical protein
MGFFSGAGHRDDYRGGFRRRNEYREDNGPQPGHRLRRIELPIFDGQNPDIWIIRTERFFQVQNYEDDEKLEASLIPFEDDALDWWHREQRSGSIYT